MLPGFLKVLGDDALQNDMTSSASDDLMTIRHRKLDHSVSVFFRRVSCFRVSKQHQVCASLQAELVHTWCNDRRAYMPGMMLN